MAFVVACLAKFSGVILQVCSAATKPLIVHPFGLLSSCSMLLMCNRVSLYSLPIPEAERMSKDARYKDSAWTHFAILRQAFSASSCWFLCQSVSRMPGRSYPNHLSLYLVWTMRRAAAVWDGASSFFVAPDGSTQLNLPPNEYQIVAESCKIAYLWDSKEFKVAMKNVVVVKEEV
jgi:hypothetical protein